MKKTLLIVVLFFASSCGAVLSGAVIKESDLSISPSKVRENPENFTGSKVIWGGIIIETVNDEDQTTVEVLATTMAKSFRPTSTVSSGRFLIRTTDYLDPLVFAKGAMITVAGEVRGIEERKIDKRNYKYPVVKPKEMRIFVEAPEDELYPHYHEAPYNPYYRPYYYPYYYPW